MGTLTREQLVKAIEDEKADRISICMSRIKSVLEELNCRIIPEIVLSGDKITAGIRIEALP